MVSLRELMDDSRPRQRIAPQQPVEPLPRHVFVPRSPVEPFAPNALDLLVEPVKTADVKGDPIEAVVSQHFPAKVFDFI